MASINYTELYGLYRHSCEAEGNRFFCDLPEFVKHVSIRKINHLANEFEIIFIVSDLSGNRNLHEIKFRRETGDQSLSYNLRGKRVTMKCESVEVGHASFVSACKEMVLDAMRIERKGQEAKQIPEQLFCCLSSSDRDFKEKYKSIFIGHQHLPDNIRIYRYFENDSECYTVYIDPDRNTCVYRFKVDKVGGYLSCGLSKCNFKFLVKSSDIDVEKLLRKCVQIRNIHSVVFKGVPMTEGNEE